MDKDQCIAIAVDPTGSAYVTGHTLSRDFPIVNAFQSSFGGANHAFGGPFGDAFVAKLNPPGSALIYSTYLGGREGERGDAIAIDSVGNAYLTGYTNSDNFPTRGPLQPAPSGITDVFITKINSAGALVYSTYLGGSDGEWGHGITVDAAGNTYVTGSTSSTDFPTLDAVQQSFGGRSGDAFVTKLNTAGSALLFSTYIGGKGSDEGRSITLDPSGNVFVAGPTDSTDFPTKAPLQSANAGEKDLFVSKLSNTGALLFSTYLGGSGNDFGAAVVNINGDTYIFGSTSSSDFPTANALQTRFGGGSSDGFITKISDFTKLFFAQFGNGSQGSLSVFTHITLVNLDSTGSANVSLEINDDSGNPLQLELDGATVAGRKDATIPADGVVTLKSSGQGPIRTGSVVVTSDRRISGVVLFGGSLGTAGVGDSKPLRKFIAPVETGIAVNTGIALMGLGQEQMIQLELRDTQGSTRARAVVTLGAKSHIAKFLTDLPWDVPPNFQNLSGSLRATGTTDFAAIVIRATPGELASLPVTEIN